MEKENLLGVLIQILLKIFFTSLFSIPTHPFHKTIYYSLSSSSLPPSPPFFFSSWDLCVYCNPQSISICIIIPHPPLSLFMCFLFNCICPPDFVLELFWVVLLLLDFLLLARNCSVSVSLTVSQRTCLSQISLSRSLCVSIFFSLLLM